MTREVTGDEQALEAGFGRKHVDDGGDRGSAGGVAWGTGDPGGSHEHVEQVDAQGLRDALAQASRQVGRHAGEARGDGDPAALGGPPPVGAGEDQVVRASR